MPSRYVAGKFMEALGIVVVTAALLAGLGVLDGQASMGKEMTLLSIGGGIFTMGWLLERGKR